MEAYLDNAATTRVFDSVKDIMIEAMMKDYGNTSSLHLKGIEAERYVKNAREIIARTLKVDGKEILFTSGGTESNNLALIGTALANKRSGNHIITTKLEHPSVLNPLIFLEEQGFRISYISVDSYGKIEEEELINEISEDTILISMMYVNNEIGSTQRMSELTKLCKDKNPNVLIHVDAIQGFGKYHIYPRRENIDLLSISGHKIHGPKGVGVLYIRDKVKVKPLMLGGGHQKGMRSGTENVPGIAGLGVAVEEIYKKHSEKMEAMYQLKREFIELLTKIDGVTINGLNDNIYDTAPQIVSVTFDGIKSEVLLHSLEEKGVYVSSGSACSSNHPSLSGTLKAIGLLDSQIDQTLRFSFSLFTTREEILYAVECLEQLLPMLRRFTRK